MAEFTEVVKKYRRMINAWRKNGYVPEKDIRVAELDISKFNETAALWFEEYVMYWAKQYPEKKYPSWADYLHNIGVLLKYLPHEALPCIYQDLVRKEIPEHIAKKLGIEPLEE